MKENRGANGMGKGDDATRNETKMQKENKLPQFVAMAMRVQLDEREKRHSHTDKRGTMPQHEGQMAKGMNEGDIVEVMMHRFALRSHLKHVAHTCREQSHAGHRLKS